MCMSCGGGKKFSAPKKQSQPPTAKPVKKKTNWSTGFGAPKVRVSFGGKRS